MINSNKESRQKLRDECNYTTSPIMTSCSLRTPAVSYTSQYKKPSLPSFAYQLESFYFCYLALGQITIADCLELMNDVRNMPHHDNYN